MVSIFIAKTRASIVRFRASVQELRRVVRLAPHDTSTEAGRSRERHRRAFFITLTSFLSRGLGAALSLVSVPLTFSYLGKEQYGLWMTLSALLTWMALADFGLARGLQNHLSEAYGSNNPRAAARYMSTAFFALLGIAVIIGTVSIPLLWRMPWERWLHVTEPDLAAELRPALLAVMLVFLAQFPLNIVGQAYAAYQRTHISNVFGIVGSVIALGITLLVIKLRLGLPYLIVASGGFTTVLIVANLLYLVRDMPWLRPKPSLVTKATFHELMKVSTPMLLFQVSALLINEVQIVIIANTAGLSAVSDWSMFMRVFQVPVIFIATIDAPYAPMLRESYVRGDAQWFRKTFFGLQRYKVMLSLLGAVLYLAFGNLCVRLLSSSAVSFHWHVWFLGGVLLLVGVWNGGYNNLFMAVNSLWVLVATIVVNGCVTLGLTYTLTRTHGIEGTLVAYMAFSALVSTWLMPLLARSIFREAAAHAEERRANAS